MKEKLKPYFDPNLPIQLLIFNWITMAGIGAGAVSGCFIAFVRQNFFAAGAAFFIAVLLIGCLYVANHHGMLQQASYCVCLLIMAIVFPCLYLLVGGARSGMPIWFGMGIVITFLILKGRSLLVFLTIETVAYSVVVWCSWKGIAGVAGETVNGIDYLGIWYTVLVSGICVGMVVKFQVSAYERELVKNEEQRIHMEVLKVEAEKASIAKGDFLANMSHEIRTPLNAIIGLSRIALREDMQDSVRGNIEDILNSSNNLLAIINDVLDFSKIESGKLEIVHAKYQLSSLIYDVSTVIRFRITEKPIEFKVEIDDTIPNTLYGDEVRIKQILTNILGNAAKFTRKGEIALKMGWKRLGGIAILHIAISDTGQGIREENLDQIFKRFKRVEMQENRQIEGTGLGLSITKGLLDRMGGTISVESTYGKGSTFHVTIPQKIIDEKPVYGEVKTQQKNAGSRKKYFESGIVFPGAKVLVVDDSVMNLKVCRGLLAPYKMSVECVGGARECLEKVAKNTYDLILLDHMMPEMDGVETLWRMREDPDFHTPVVALTANAVNGAKKSYLDWGFMDYLSKPMHLEDLEVCLKKYLGSFMQKQLSTEKAKQDAAAPEAKTIWQGQEAIALKPEQMPEEKAAETENAVAEEKLPPDKHIFNIEQGMEYAVGNEEFYIETLQIYLDETEESRMMLREYLETENLSDYKVLVHALKSNSRLVGAVATSELALQMEEASRDGELEFVQSHHEELMERLELAKKYIRQYLKEHHA